MYRRPFTRVWRIVDRSVKVAFSSRYLLFTNLTLSAGLSAAADLVVQRSSRKIAAGSPAPSQAVARPRDEPLVAAVAPTIDRRRVANMAASGLLLGLVGHYWYLWLDSRAFRGTITRVVVKKTLTDLSVLSPVVILLFFFSLGYLDGHRTADIWKDVRAKGPHLLLIDWLVYLPVQFINFRFLPTRLRVLYDCAVAFVLDMYYCHTRFERD